MYWYPCGPGYQENRPFYPYRKMGHFDAEGYAFIGNRIVAEIARN